MNRLDRDLLLRFGHHPPLYRAAQVRDFDRLAMTEHGLGEGRLMARAGQALWAFIQTHWPGRTLSVVCGAGNNGGDGYVLARLAANAGIAVQVIAASPVERLSGDAAAAAQAWLAAGGEIDVAHAPLTGQLIVDGLLGSGLRGPVTGDWAALIERINASGRPVLAIDVPSGLNADSGQVEGMAVRANVTLTFIARKCGLVIGQAAEQVGQLVFEDLGVPAVVTNSQPPQGHWMQSGPQLSARHAAVHKGQLGHVLVVGGELGMAGAAQLAAWAALRAGSGLVSVATRPEHASALSAACPELMVHGVSSAAELAVLLERADVVCLGPGLGQGAWGHELFEWLALEQGVGERPLVLDADGLNLLAEAQPEPASNHNPLVLTPHVGEAARLLAVSTDKIMADRFAAAQAIAERYHASCVLKGRGTIVADASGQVWVCDRGSPAMATAGMGDALTGVVGSLIGQTSAPPFEAAAAGVWVHAVAGEQVSQGRRQIIVRELIDGLPVVMQEVTA